jgi:hypothetical protein
LVAGDQPSEPPPSKVEVTRAAPLTPWGEVTIPARIARRQRVLSTALAGAPWSGNLALCRAGLVGMVGVLHIKGHLSWIEGACMARAPGFESPGL